MRCLRRHICLLLLLVAAMVHTEARPRIGLVLSGGGAKGAAEIGALKVIERYGIPIDCIAGTSIGSIVGSLYAAGYRTDELEPLFTNQEWISLLTDWRSDLADKVFAEADSLTYIFGFPFLNDPTIGLFRGRRIHEMLDSMFCQRGCRYFDQLPTPFCCVGARFWSAEEKVLNEGVVADAVRSSIAIPLLLKPGIVDETRLVDGGMMNNLPIDVVRQKMQADILIVIDLTQQKPRTVSEDNIWRVIRDLGASVLDFFIGSNIISWVLHRPDNQKYLDNLHSLGPNDIYINPRLDGFGLFSFDNDMMTEMIIQGEKAARRNVTKLLRLRLQLLPYI